MKYGAMLIALPFFLLVPSGEVDAQDSTRVKPLGGISFDYQNADLGFVITALAEAAGLNVSYSSLPQKPVTLRTNAPVQRAEVRGLLMSVLQSNGLRVIEEGTLLRIEPVAQQEVQDPRRAAGGEPRIYVYRLKHAEATRLASTIQVLFGGAASPTGGSGLSRGGLSQDLLDQRIPAAGSDTRSPNERTATSGLNSRVAGSLQIHADELTNSLLIRASPGDWAVVQEAILALDLRPLQVVIEVLIAEVRRSSNLTIGTGIKVPQTRDPNTGIIAGGDLAGSSTGDLIVRLMNVGGISADIVLSALSSKGDVTILSRPVILALNNQEARILVGSQRPFVQVFRSLPTDNAVRDQVVQYRDVGTSLTIRPTINHDGYVSLSLLQEVSTATNETQFGAPVISTREAQTQLLVKNKHTIVIGGLIDRQQDRTRGGIPLLKDIPIIGALFGSTQRSNIHTELFLFLTPHIIASDEDAEGIKNSIEEGSKLLRKHLPDPGPLSPDTSRATVILPDTSAAPGIPRIPR